MILAIKIVMVILNVKAHSDDDNTVSLWMLQCLLYKYLYTISIGSLYVYMLMHIEWPYYLQHRSCLTATRYSKFFPLIRCITNFCKHLPDLITLHFLVTNGFVQEKNSFAL